MKPLLEAIRVLPEYRTLIRRLDRGDAVGVAGAAQLCRSHVLASLMAETEDCAVVVCQDEIAARRVQSELEALLGTTFPILPQRELTLYDASAVSRGWEHRRLRLLYQLSRGELPGVIAPVTALRQRTMPPRTLLRAAVTLKPGDVCPPQDLAERLTAAGYRRGELVEGVGQFALRGGILDVFSPGEDLPVRVEFFGDEVDCIGAFDPDTQRRTENLEEILLLPAAETQPGLHAGGAEGLREDLDDLIARQRRRRNPHEKLIATLTADRDRLADGLPLTAADRYMALIYPEYACAADYLPAESRVYLCDHGNLARAAKAEQDDLGLELDSCLQAGLLVGELCDYTRTFDELCDRFREIPTVYFDSFLAAQYPESRPPKELVSFTCKQIPSYGGNLDTAAEDIRHYQTAGFSTLVLCGGAQRAEILRQALADRDIAASVDMGFTAIPEPGKVLLVGGTLPAGLEYPTLRLAVLSEGQLMTEAAPRKTRRKKADPNRKKIEAFTDLRPGDLVVHDQYGIGRYTGMEQIRSDGVVKDYIRIAYQGTDVLFIPATQLHMIAKYIGGGETAVRLDKLDGDHWKKAKARAKASAKDLAAGLIQLYAQRKRLPGYAFSADTPWQREFEDAFPYPETDDQIRCIAEIKKDMESPAPMDRLLCGDVGFGKTEVAFRAIMKAILDGKQAAILAPTTVLAQQHYMTATERFRSYGVEVAVLSRFQSPKQNRKTLDDLRSGRVDLIIGTHKLLQKNVEFRNLGLLVVDEEQRFGVSHKERLKEMSVGVDVLTLSATPIPRTLNMALSGIRDMSTIEEPPRDRYPVQTFVLEYAEPVLDDAMRRELERGGQVYYLHNRTETILETAAAIRKRMGGVEVSVAHGQMGEEELSDVMQRMAEGEVRILVCTTIIETGIDIPNVNTLIIEDADRLGLAQLHQIRGRVGRSSRHAFAYLTFRRGKVLSEVAEKRLEAIREYAEFGSGFKIAMRDLEIRGAGDLLGAEQSGHIMTVGYEMYLKLLEDAVLEEKGEERPKEPDCVADLTVSANIAQDYVPAAEQRMDLYRRMARIRSREDADELLDEIVDRFGDPPKNVLNLIDIALLRADASRVGITEIRQREGSVWMSLSTVDLRAVAQVCDQKAFRPRASFSAGRAPMLQIRLRQDEDPLRLSAAVVSAYGQAVRETPAGSN